MINVRCPISLMSLKNKLGELYHQFMGCRQHDSHEFLLTWLHEDLTGGYLSALRSYDCLFPVYASQQPTRECSAISLLFYGEYGQIITYGRCHYALASQEPFTVLSLSIPTSGECTLTNLKKQNYVDFPLEQLNLSDQASKDKNVVIQFMCCIESSWKYEWWRLYKLLQAIPGKSLVPL